MCTSLDKNKKACIIIRFKLSMLLNWKNKFLITNISNLNKKICLNKLKKIWPMSWGKSILIKTWKIYLKVKLVRMFLIWWIIKILMVLKGKSLFSWLLLLQEVISWKLETKCCLMLNPLRQLLKKTILKKKLILKICFNDCNMSLQSSCWKYWTIGNLNLLILMFKKMMSKLLLKKKIF